VLGKLERALLAGRFGNLASPGSAMLEMLGVIAAV